MSIIAGALYERADVWKPRKMLHYAISKTWLMSVWNTFKISLNYVSSLYIIGCESFALLYCLFTIFDLTVINSMLKFIPINNNTVLFQLLIGIKAVTEHTSHAVF